MFRSRIKSKYRGSGNWIINLYVLLCNLNIIISHSCNDPETGRNVALPVDWPCDWNYGIIPFVFDFFSMSPNRLISLVRRGHAYLEKRSCLFFIENNPVDMARQKNITYLFYTYSEVLETCCLRYYSKPHGKRLVLITPVCSLPNEVGHATLHGMGLNHTRDEMFPENVAVSVLFPSKCLDYVSDDAADNTKKRDILTQLKLKRKSIKDLNY